MTLVDCNKIKRYRLKPLTYYDVIRNNSDEQLMLCDEISSTALKLDDVKHLLRKPILYNDIGVPPAIVIIDHRPKSLTSIKIAKIKIVHSGDIRYNEISATLRFSGGCDDTWNKYGILGSIPPDSEEVDIWI